jgi:hypothetical protein
MVVLSRRRQNSHLIVRLLLVLVGLVRSEQASTDNRSDPKNRPNVVMTLRASGASSISPGVALIGLGVSPRRRRSLEIV